MAMTKCTPQVLENQGTDISGTVKKAGRLVKENDTWNMQATLCPDVTFKSGKFSL